MEIVENDSIFLSELQNLISSDDENKMCFDCKIPYPKYVSINNGVFICDRCAEIHRTLGTAISYIRGIEDEWDVYLLMFIQRGGNGRMRYILNSYGLIDESDIKYKYITKASEYHRQLVKKIKNS